MIEKERERREEKIIQEEKNLPLPIIHLIHILLYSGHPKRMPRIPRRNVGTPSSSSSTSYLSSLTPETEEPPTSAKQKLHFELSCIPEGGGDDQGEGYNADDFLKSLRERRMAAKVGEKNVMLDANINTKKMSGQSEEKEVEELSDSSSEKFSTPPTTAEQLATAISSSHTPEDTPTPSDDAASDPVLERMRQRRLELKQQRELSGKKSNASDSPPTTTKTRTETTKNIETFPPPVGPTQLSTTANSSQHSVGGDESSQTTTTVDMNTSLFTGVYCPKCHCKVLLGQNFCSYCGKPVSMLFRNKGPPSTGTVQVNKKLLFSFCVAMFAWRAHSVPCWFCCSHILACACCTESFRVRVQMQ